MADLITEWTDERLAELETEVSSIYTQAQSEISEKWDAYMKRGEKRLSKLYDASISEGTDEAKEAYERALRNYTLRNDDYKAMIDEVTSRLTKTNEIALDYSKNQMPDIYAKNYGAVESVLIDSGVDKVYKILPEDTIKRMILKGDIETPWTRKMINEGKDIRWNTKQINSSVLQGIIQGESMDKIAKRLEPIMDRNEASAIRNARTMVTGAQNAGRLDSYKQLEKDGVVLNKVWEATGDGRTRDWHLEMDGQEVGLHEDFIDGNGERLEYPGDPGGPPESVYNCRCSMHEHIIGFRRKDGSISYVEESGESYAEEQHSREIEAERERRQSGEQQTVVNGTDISETWQRRPDQFDFEIQDVINAQGFDGLPQVVSPEEFDKAVQESSFIAQRTYSAPNQETLDAYRDQLYHGEWYVDCSTGGAQYGQGMYCAADYNGQLTDGIKSEMRHYQELGEQRNYGSGIDNLSLDSFNSQSGWSLSNEEYLAHKRAYDSGWKALSDDDKLLIRESGHSILEFDDAISSVEIPKAVSYTETLTLDPSARIITYDDLHEMYKSEMTIFEQRKVDEFVTERVSGLSKESQEHVREALEKFDHPMDAIRSGVLKSEEEFDVWSSIRKDRDLIRSNAIDEYTNQDIGSFAVKKGYDAINAEGHGESGSYTVILNRTKLIIKGE